MNEPPELKPGRVWVALPFSSHPRRIRIVGRCGKDLLVRDENPPPGWSDRTMTEWWLRRRYMPEQEWRALYEQIEEYRHDLIQASL